MEVILPPNFSTELLLEVVTNKSVERVLVKFGTCLTTFRDEYADCSFVSLTDWLTCYCYDGLLFEELLASPGFPQKAFRHKREDPRHYELYAPYFYYALFEERCKELEAPMMAKAEFIDKTYEEMDDYWIDSPLDGVTACKVAFLQIRFRPQDAKELLSSVLIEVAQKDKEFIETVHYLTENAMELSHSWSDTAFGCSLGNPGRIEAFELLMESGLTMKTIGEDDEELDVLHDCLLTQFIPGLLEMGMTELPSFWESFSQCHCHEDPDEDGNWKCYCRQFDPLEIPKQNLQTAINYLAPRLILRTPPRFAPGAWWARTSYLLGGVTYQMVDSGLEE